MRTAIHLHTHYSFDSNFAVREVLDAALREGIHCLTITDHNEIDGALEARDIVQREQLPIKVIIGEEVCSADGHVIGLFLRERIKPGPAAREIIAEIHDQGGIALAPHPFATLCDSSLSAQMLDLVDVLDGVEIHNAQNPLAWEDRKAARFATEHDLPGYVGCDTHIHGRLAPAYQELVEFDTPTEFLAALRTSKQTAGRFGVGYYAIMAYRHFWDMIMPSHAPGFGAMARPKQEHEHALRAAAAERAAQQVAQSEA